MWNYGSGMMGSGYGGWGSHMLFGGILWVALLVAVVFFFTQFSGTPHHDSQGERRAPALDVLEERYARGEINREEYIQKKRDITGRAVS